MFIRCALGFHHFVFERVWDDGLHNRERCTRCNKIQSEEVLKWKTTSQKLPLYVESHD